VGLSILNLEVAPVLGGRIVQRHEGDWEAVTVGLSDAKPLFVAF
jgi:hypothetical protein